LGGHGEIYRAASFGRVNYINLRVGGLQQLRLVPVFLNRLFSQHLFAALTLSDDVHS
jgi:hypothetical protein